jgi:putative ATPase
VPGRRPDPAATIGLSLPPADLDDHAPLAARVRPRDLSEFVGQVALVGERGPLRRMVEHGRLGSMVFWGPPGSGKTTLARLLAEAVGARYVTLSAVMSGVADVRATIAGAREWLDRGGAPTVLFLDEIHRFNKAQQDALLPQVEDGTITLIGATTENPYFEVNSALLSRTRVFRLEPLEDADVRIVVERAMVDARGYGGRVSLAPDALEHLVGISGGDARAALNILEAAVGMAEVEGTDSPSLEVIETAAQQRVLAYDRAGDGHYDTVSAFIKSIRGNDPDAALYWLATMVAAGEDPRFIARRLLILASEDVGNADPRGLEIAVAAAQALEWVGLPEAQYALAQATVWLSVSPKSDAIGRAYGAAMADVLRLGSVPVPMHLRTAGDRRLKRHGIGVGYRDPHEVEGDDVDQQYLPDQLAGRRYYVPGDQGYEPTIAARMAARVEGRAEEPRRKRRPDPPMASMSDAMKPREGNRKQIAEKQRRDASQ